MLLQPTQLPLGPWPAMGGSARCVSCRWTPERRRSWWTMRTARTNAWWRMSWAARCWCPKVRWMEVFPGRFPGISRGILMNFDVWVGYNGRTTPMIEHGWLENPPYRSMVFPAVKLHGGLLEPVMNQHKRFMFVRLVDPWDKSRKWGLVN